MLLTIETTGVAIKAKLFRGFGDRSRLSILETLRTGPHPVGDLVEETGLSQSNVSNHLGCLRDCGLVTSVQTGRSVTYQLSDDRVGDLLGLAEALLADVARGVYECTRYNIPTTEIQQKRKPRKPGSHPMTAANRPFPHP